jgi:hypothetical protein
MAVVDGTELRNRLLPCPHELNVLGEPRPVAGDLVATCGFDPQTSPWDPKNVLMLPHLTWKPIHLEGEGTRCVVVVASEQSPIAPERLKDALQSAAAVGVEGYVLRTFPSDSECAIVASDGPRGLLYGLQTLSQLLARDPGHLPHVSIVDAPDVNAREIHIHGFDKGYGAGDLKSIAAFTTDLPAVLPWVSRGRYNLFRVSLDVAWVLHGDTWTGQNIDPIMRQVVSDCHRYGIDLLVELRMQGQREGAADIDTYPLNPLTEWPVYEKAFRRVLSWSPDAIDLSLNDLGPLNYQNVVAAYGTDGRYSGRLMAELLVKAKAIIDQVKPGTRLYHLPRFYGDVHWKAHPRAMPDLWENVPAGVVMYVTTNLDHPTLTAMRQQYHASFAQWVNLTSNHAKELRVMLSSQAPPGLKESILHLPLDERRILLNLGYPIPPQMPIALAGGDMLWNLHDYESERSFANAAREVWGEGPADLFLQYARLLDTKTILATLGQQAAAVLNKPKRIDEDAQAIGPTNGKRNAPPANAEQWSQYVDVAQHAASIARELQDAVKNPQLNAVAEILYWNARRVELDSRVGEILAKAVAKHAPPDRNAVEKLLHEHEQILADHYPVEPNDPKSAEVVTRGIRRIRETLDSQTARTDVSELNSTQK